MNHYTESNLLAIVEEILKLDSAMRFVAIIDLKGNVLEAIMKEKKTSLETQKQQEHRGRQHISRTTQVRARHSQLVHIRHPQQSRRNRRISKRTRHRYSHSTTKTWQEERSAR